MLAGGLGLADRLDVVLAVLGPGCDGELELDEVLARVAALAAVGAWIGTSSVAPALADELEAAAAATATEASMQVVHCARGLTGTATIRGGRRRVPLGPVGAQAFYFDLSRAAEELPLTRAVLGCESLADARDALIELGASTELDYERERAAAD
jgi:hypothetical protein